MGITFTNALSMQRAQLFQNLMNGSGVAAADVDGDGRVDLFFCARQSANRLYRNLGDGRFEDVTVAAGVGCTNQTSSGAVFGDINGDGAPDLVVSGFGGPHAVLLNDGKGRFTDVTAASGLSSKTGATSVALGDLDGDGDLDVYWCNFGVQSILRDGGVVSTRLVNGQPQVTGRHANRVRIENGMLVEYGEPDVLALNDGTGRFTPVVWEQVFSDPEGRPMAPPLDFGLAVQIREVDGDGAPDIHVCNDFQTPDRLWLGDGRGRFREASPLALRNMSYASMGVDFADIDRDGRLDFITVEMLSRDLRQHLRTISPMQPVRRIPGDWRGREEMPRNALYRARGDGTYDEIAQFAGVAATSWSWAPLFLDVDLDGWEDLLVSNGHLRDVNNRDVADEGVRKPGQALQSTKDKLQRYPSLEPGKMAFRNRRDLTFEDVSKDWGFDSRRIAHGMITVDLDGDGDLDVVANALNGPPLVWRNLTSVPRVAVRLRGLKPNTAGIGARITLLGGPVGQTQEMVAGGQYLSSSEPLRCFAAGTGEMTLQVDWRSGRRSVIRGVRPDCAYEIEESAAVVPGGTPRSGAVPNAGWFAAFPGAPDAAHAERFHDDATLQPLIPQKYSQLGPSVSAADLDGDGHADLLMGAGRGGKPRAFRGDGKGGFAEMAVGGGEAGDDLLGIALVPGGDGSRRVVMAMANYESGASRSAPSAVVWGVGAAGLVPDGLLPGGEASAGPVASGDVDGDGDLDVFVGARLTARRWPQPGGSMWHRNEGGRLVPEVAGSTVFGAVGPVADALLADLTGDGRPEVVLAVEIGGIRVFSFRDGGWVAMDPRVEGVGGGVTRLSAMTGWWNAVATGDFDGDGRLDLVVGNRGRNTAWQVWGDGLPEISWADAGDGTVAVVEGVKVEGRVRPVRDRGYLAAGLVGLTERFPSHDALAEATVGEVWGGRVGVRTESVRVMASVVLLNRGEGFEARELPAPAQWAPVSGIAVADFDGDGAEDVFLGQNLFAVRAEDSRLDAGRGLLLRGDGRGGFVPVDGLESGLGIYGEQRGVAAADFDEDGRMDLVVCQNGAEMRVYRNAKARVGLRVRLAGPAGNPDGIGAVVRPVRVGKAGVAKVVGAGSYGSPGGTVVLLGGDRPESVEVLWPGGRRSVVQTAAGMAEARVGW